MDVSIIVVSWRVKNQVLNCLATIFKETKNLTFEIIVIENDSQDGTVEALKSRFPQVTVIENHKNEGFAKACNQGIYVAKGRYILLLNPDTEIRDNAIYRVATFMEQQPSIGVAGCKILNPDGTLQPSVRRFPDLASHLLILLKIHNFFPHVQSLKKYYCTDFDYHKTSAVDQVMGAFFMISRTCLKIIGLLDEHYFIWYEEVDFCKRAALHSLKTYFYSETYIVHHKAKSFEQRGSLTKQAIFTRSMLYYFLKHEPAFSYALLLLLYPISLMLSFLTMVFGIKKIRKDL